MKPSPRQSVSPATRVQQRRPDLATRSSGMVMMAISIGVLTLTVLAAWTTVGPAA